MSIFPEVSPSQNIDTPQNINAGYKNIYFDYATKTMSIENGKTRYCTKKEKLQNWIRLLIYTQIDKFNVYKNTDFGIDILEIIGYQFATSHFEISELKRELKEKIEAHIDVQSVRNIIINNNFNVIKIEVFLICDNLKEKIEVKIK